MKCLLGFTSALPLLLALAMPFRAQAAASLEPVDLTCEYLKNPLGLDVREPRLSWKLHPIDPSTRGQKQTAYRVLVASDRALLDRDNADLWDSRWTESGESHLITYGGKPLRSGQACWWKVRVKDQRARVSSWSRSAQWSVGLLDPSDWTAKWIGTAMNFERKPGSAADNSLPDPWLRKSFPLERAPKRAILYVASVGYHDLYVNGRKVGDAVLSPCATDHTHRARYVAYDITASLRPGQNVVGLWLGFSWSIFPPYLTADKPASPIVIAQADLEFLGGKTLRICTDETWRWFPSPNTTIGVWDFMHFGGELYDAGKELPQWCEATCDDSKWNPVKVFEPKLVLSAQKVEPNRTVKEIKPVAIAEPKPGAWRIDMGVNFAGWIEMKLTGSPGDKIELKWSERPEQEMTHQLHSFYVIGPSGQGTFRNHFNYGVGRWIQIEGLRQKPALSDIRGWLIRTDYEPAASFTCSDDLMNRIYSTTLWTYETLSLGGYLVDCAQRERMGYGGDAHATTATGMDAFKTAALYTKWAEDWRDVQGKAAAWGVGKKEDELGSGKKVEPGNLPYTAPTYWGGGGPGWSGYCVTLPWEMYRRFGDRQILQQMLPTIERWLGFVETKARDNLLRRYGGEWDFLGDWLWPGAKGVNGDTRETLFFNNCYWVFNLQTAARIANALGRSDLESRWLTRAQVVREAIHRQFFNPVDNSYVNGFQAYLAVALLTDIPPRELRVPVLKRLEEEILVKRQGHFWGGITGGSFVVKELVEAERPDLMFAMASQQDYPGWGDMLKKGATTIWEDWEGNLSLCHSSYLHIGAWFIEGLGGIRPGLDGAGYKHFFVRPGVWPTSPLEWAKCRFDSPYGPIESNWRREGERMLYDISVPPNTVASVSLRTEDRQKLTESGRPLSRAKGVRQAGPQGPCTVLELQPGQYHFEAK
ncbi:MAG TPA: family 78 glycoside hydrolase catalytic domain [Verrucomicrobiae bacterium]